MVDIVTIDKSAENSCEATGHPSECTEPFPGQVVKTSDHNVTITNSNGVTKQVATVASADMVFDPHSHDYSNRKGCHQDSGHTLDPDPGKLASVSINGSKAYVVENNVTSDPVTGEAVNIVDAGINNSMRN